jgi:hypothetical protein
VRIRKSTPPSITPGVTRVRKNMDMDPAKLDAARAVLGTSSDTETVDAALAFVVSQGRVLGALEAMAADGGLADVYADEPRRRMARVSERARKR